MIDWCIAMDTTLPVLIMGDALPTVYFSGSLCFAWKQTLLLLIVFTLQHHSVSWMRHTAGRLRRPPPDWPDRLLRGSLRPTARLQWLSRSCCRLINDDRYGVAKQNKIKINIAVSLTESDLRRDELRSQVSGWKTSVGESQLLYFNHFMCFEKPTKVALYNNL